ncbi:MAG: hypothetical protein KF841_16805 [Phycisphaerae bacterium]|nr:hypothetical protein [Phycisphaerae bacterium]
MKQMFLKFTLAAAITLIAAVQATRAADIGSGFTYQGSLTDNGSLANGQYDFEFRLYNGPFGVGTIIAGPIAVGDVDVVDGLFTVKLDFGAAMGHGARWLDIRVRPGASNGSHMLLLPRQELTPTPFAAGLALPYNASYTHNSPLVTLNQTGAGNALSLNSSSADCLVAAAAGTGDAVYANSSGTGMAINAYANGGGHALYGQTTNGGTGVYGYSLGTSGRAGFFRTEHLNNASNAIEAQANGTGHGIKATARTASAGFFENTSSSNSASTLRSQNSGSGSAVWGQNIGTGPAARFNISNTSSNSTALIVRNDGNGLAASFERGDVKIQGQLYATIGTVLNRATPIAFGRFDAFGNLMSSSGNVTISYQPNGTWRVFVVGEGDPDKWVITTSVDYYEANTDLEYVAKSSRPLAVAGQPGNGVIYIKDQCKNGCNEFQINHYVNFVIYKGV